MIREERTMKKFSLAMIAIAVGLVFAQTASAQTFNFTFTGTITETVGGITLTGLPVTFTGTATGPATLLNGSTGDGTYALKVTSDSEYVGGVVNATFDPLNLVLAIGQGDCSSATQSQSVTSCVGLAQFPSPSTPLTIVNLAESPEILGDGNNFFSNYTLGTPTGNPIVGTVSFASPAPITFNNGLGPVTLTNYSVSATSFYVPEGGTGFMYLLLAGGVCCAAMFFKRREKLTA
jgi:hypothetical protein